MNASTGCNNCAKLTLIFPIDLTYDLGLTSLKKVRIKNMKNNEPMIPEGREMDGKQNVFTEKKSSDVTGGWSIKKAQYSYNSYTIWANDKYLCASNVTADDSERREIFMIPKVTEFALPHCLWVSILISPIRIFDSKSLDTFTN